MLPVTLTTVPVCEATFTMLVNIPLLAVTLPDTLTTAPVWLATFTMLVNMPLLAIALPVTLSVVPEITFAPEILPPDPEVIILPPVTLPVTLTTVPVCEATFTMLVNMPLLAVTFPDNDNVPVEALNVNFVVVTLAT